MNTEIELRKWLSRTEHSFIENLDFGIKVWNSIDFVLLTKHEIILDEFCNNLPKLRKEISKSSDQTTCTETAWKKINELLNLRYSAGAVSVLVKDKLIKSLTIEANASIKEHQPSIDILNALLTTLHSTSMQNFYKSNTMEYAKFIGTNVQYLIVYVNNKNTAHSLDDVQQKQFKEIVDAILNELKTFIKQTPFLDTFKSAFSNELLRVLCEMVILLKSYKLDYSSEFFAIVQELFFDGSQTEKLKKYFKSKATERAKITEFTEYLELFEVPMHVFLIITETVIISYRNDSDVQKCFFHYLFNENDGRLNVVGDDAKLQLNCLIHFIQLLKKHDMPINFEIDSMKALTYLGRKIENTVNEHHLTYLYEAMNLVCATLKLNPLILEHSACQIAVKFMLLAKTDEPVWRKYEELMFLLIDMYRKLSRAEKFIAQLIKNLYETLTTVKLSKKLKRTFNASFVEGSTPSKRIKTTLDQSISVETGTQAKEIDYIQLLDQNLQNECYPNTAPSGQVTLNGSTQIWNDIAFAFPPTISNTYTRFISGLISKPSLVVWKTLIFTLKDYVKQLNDVEGKSPENTIFLIEISSALLSQYFMGSRLAEQSDKTWKSIEQNRTLTYAVLADFGRAILNQEHNYRTMNAFLKLSYNVSNFDLLSWYYCPDSMDPNNDIVDSDSPKIDGLKCAQNIHSYLTDKEWTIIEQRITNFGKLECKSNINKIYLQRLKATQLFSVDQNETRANIAKYISSTTFADAEQIAGILADETMSAWFINNLDATQMRAVCELLLQSSSEVNVLSQLSFDNREFVNILILSIYKCIIDILSSGKKTDYLIAIDFEKYFANDLNASVSQLNNVIEQIVTERLTGDKKLIQKSHDEILSYLCLLNCLPIGFCKQNIKNITFLLNTIVYRNLRAANDAELNEKTLKLFKTILHFDEFPAIFDGLKIKTLISVFSDEPDAQLLYDMIFDRVVKDLSESNIKMLDDLLILLKAFDQNEQEQQETLLDIAAFAVVNLSKNKKNKEYYAKFRLTLFHIIKQAATVADAAAAQKCVEKTLPAFATIIKTVLAGEEADGDVTDIFKLFTQHTIDCRNPYSIKLLNISVNNKLLLKFSDDELKSLIDKYWNDFKQSCTEITDETINKTKDTILKIIFDYKSTDEWIELLNEVETDIKTSLYTERAEQQSKILASMSKCQLNKVKGQIFSEFFKKTSFWINITIRSKATDLSTNFDTVLHLLECYTIIANNVQIPVSIDLIDDILSLLSEINIKKIQIDEFGLKHFVNILNQMIDLCLALINHRHVFIMDRVPHFTNVFKDLVQTICWYKSNRSKQIQLEQAEVTMLAEMAHKLEKMMKSFVKHTNEIKRVAPYLLVFVINLMISNDRPTTLYPKIKTHIEYICYDLIASCDHRAESFILRSCNEASKPVYEILHKEYEKYFKFKGKV